MGLMDSGGPDRWQAAQPQSLQWVCIHPEVPNSQPGSRSLTLVRMAWPHCGFNPSSPCPQSDTAQSLPLVCLGCRVFYLKMIWPHYTHRATSNLKNSLCKHTRQTRQFRVSSDCSTIYINIYISALLQASSPSGTIKTLIQIQSQPQVLLLFH